MELRILTFGIAVDLTGGKVLNLPIQEDSIKLGELKALLVKNYSKLTQLDSFLLAVNDEYAKDENLVIKATDEVALIPPTSGG